MHSLLLTEWPTVPFDALGCSASTEFNGDHKCAKALDDNVKTDWAAKQQCEGAFIKVMIKVSNQSFSYKRRQNGA